MGHDPYGSLAPEHWEWVPSFMFLFKGNFMIHPQDASNESLLNFDVYMMQGVVISEFLHPLYDRMKLLIHS